MKPLAGRTALVTGGTRGIGAAVSEKLVNWGAHVTAGYVDNARAASALQKQLGEQLALAEADISTAAGAQELVQQALTDAGALDILIHCAAAASYGNATELTDKQWNFTRATTLDSLRYLAEAATEPLSRSKHGRLIAISNTMPHRIVPGGAALAVAKAGVETLTRYLAYELAPYGVVVNAIQPGLVMTDVLKVRPQYAHTHAQERSASPWPGNRTTTAKDVAHVAAALCLDEMGWMSGQVIPVDGGASQWGWLGERHA